MEHFLAHAPPLQVDPLIRAERDGRLDVGGMWAHFTPLMDRGAMSWTMDRTARRRDEHGFAIRSAMDCDINGLPWPWVDELLDGGINGFTMSINEHRGRSPTRPRAWWWQGPSGRKILTWCGENYNWGRWYGVPQDINQAEAEFAQYLQRLEASGYPYSFAYLQSTGELNWGDNNWPSEQLSEFVRTWNERGNTPRFEIVTLSGFLDALRVRLGDDIPTIRGDWCDWWAFGVASMPRHTALLRQTQEKLALCHRLMARFDNEPKVESWRRQLRMVLLGDTAPRSIYFIFEAAMKGGVFWYDAAGAPTRNDHQVPGSCHDYVSIGQWAAIAGSPQSMLLLSPDVPMLQPGGFNYLQLRQQPPAVLDAPMLVSWPVNNHKEVNFPVRQTGVLVLRYTVRRGPVGASEHWLCQEAQRLSRSWCWLPYVRWE